MIRSYTSFPHLLTVFVLCTLVLILSGCSRSDTHTSPSAHSTDSIDTLTHTDIVAHEAEVLSEETKTIIKTIDESDSLPFSTLTPVQRDSLEFRLRHHYSEGFNFRVTADSLQLVPRIESLPLTDTSIVHQGDLLVVAEVARKESADSLAPDTFLIKVAHDQLTQGWVEESELLRSVVPDDSISQLLHSLTSSRGIWMNLLVLIGLLSFVLYRHVSTNRDWLSLLRHSDSWYAPLLLTLVILLAATYASVQLWVPEFWQEYYFHPTLNPLLLPCVMCWMMVLVWLIIVTFIALIIEIYHRYFFLQGLVYLVEVLGLAMLAYLIVSWTAQIYVGYLLALVLIILVWHFFLRPKQSKERL